ncbi:MAG TPA: class I SAM-dependent methyltransferase [Candidatus Binataceae bacterium]|nr:class I SAM-dependent methyltransferase [Candidatus Binataceae bacterium]
MAQNIYDDAGFFAEYSRLPRSIDGLRAAPEWPSLRAMLPDLHGKRVVDLGCGFGWFCRWARESGAAHILGIDVSEKMLARAIEETRDAAITYVRSDLETLELPVAAFDVAYSSLAFHYIEDFRGLAANIRQALVENGRLIFSVEHPIYTAPSEPTFVRNSAGRATWPLDDYLDEGPRSTDWLAKRVIKHHRTLATYLNALVDARFSILCIDEWGPTPEHIAAHPDWADDHQRPPFLLMSARR